MTDSFYGTVMKGIDPETTNLVIGSESLMCKREAKLMQCMKCGGGPMRRMKRKGFLQNYIYCLQGYYPWECSECRQLSMVKHRGTRKHRHTEAKSST